MLLCRFRVEIREISKTNKNTDVIIRNRLEDIAVAKPVIDSQNNTNVIYCDISSLEKAIYQHSKSRVPSLELLYDKQKKEMRVNKAALSDFSIVDVWLFCDGLMVGNK